VGKVSKLLTGGETRDFAADSTSSMPALVGPPGALDLGGATPRRGWNSIVASAVGVLASGDDDLSPVQTQHAQPPASQLFSGEHTAYSAVPAAYGSAPVPQQRVQPQTPIAAAAFTASTSTPASSDVHKLRATDASSRGALGGDGRKPGASAAAASARRDSSASPRRRENGGAEHGSSGTWGTLLRSTVGEKLRSMVGAPKQASMGVENKFYFNEKLGRWVVEGEENAVEAEPPLAPPPISDAFSDAPAMSESHAGLHAAPANVGPAALPEVGVPTSAPLASDAPSRNAAAGAKMPPRAPVSGATVSFPAARVGAGAGAGAGNSSSSSSTAAGNRYSARPRTGARSRYVDTFGNQDAHAAVPSLAVLPPSLAATASSGNVGGGGGVGVGNGVGNGGAVPFRGDNPRGPPLPPTLSAAAQPRAQPK